jgi:hypothetical protein
MLELLSIAVSDWDDTQMGSCLMVRSIIWKERHVLDYPRARKLNGVTIRLVLI